ncbi:D-alanine--D-alanine ligase [Phycisphaeraceae bacterium D3-23]
MPEPKLNVLVLLGGPDRERPVSLQSGGQVAQALRDAGHTVTESDVMPDDISAIEDAKAGGVEVVFPVLHGPWGEGGPLQAVLESSGLAFVGCRPDAAARCMDKWAAKAIAHELGIPTAPAEVLTSITQPRTVKAPVVIKALDEGSSFGMAICHTEPEAEAAVAELLKTYKQVMAERYIAGDELTVGVLEGFDAAEPRLPRALPVIKILPAAAFYDYDAKYTRDDTSYLFDAEPPDVLQQVQDYALRAFRGLGCQHLARIDFMLDADKRPWLLEANTMPGFTSHSLVPKAAAHAGIAFPALCDRLVRMALPSSKDKRAAQ